MGVIAIIVVALLVGVVVMNDMTKKGYLNELETALELSDFQLKVSGGKATVGAKWRGMPFQMKANSKMVLRQTDIIYATEHRFDFSASITPGSGLLAPEAGVKPKGGAEENSARPWRVKLTAEEQKVIDERRGTEASVEIPQDKFAVRSNKADVTAKFLQQREHSEALEELFKAGMSEVRFSPQGLTLVKNHYDNNDMLPKQVEKYLAKMKALVN